MRNFLKEKSDYEFARLCFTSSLPLSMNWLAFPVNAHRHPDVFMWPHKHAHTCTPKQSVLPALSPIAETHTHTESSGARQFILAVSSCLPSRRPAAATPACAHHKSGITTERRSGRRRPNCFKYWELHNAHLWSCVMEWRGWGARRFYISGRNHCNNFLLLELIYRQHHHHCPSSLSSCCYSVLYPT